MSNSRSRTVTPLRVGPKPSKPYSPRERLVWLRSPNRFAAAQESACGTLRTCQSRHRMSVWGVKRTCDYSAATTVPEPKRFKHRAQRKFHYPCTRCSYSPSSASLMQRMSLMEITPMHNCGVPSLMDAIPSSIARIRVFSECRCHTSASYITCLCLD